MRKIKRGKFWSQTSSRLGFYSTKKFLIVSIRILLFFFTKLRREANKSRCVLMELTSNSFIASSLSVFRYIIAVETINDQNLL